MAQASGLKEKSFRYIELMRPHQYLKNAFVFLPLFFGGMMTHQVLLVRCLLAFCSFCLVSSAVYVFNDYLDAEDDRRHPVKKFRPLASGRVSGAEARIFLLVLVLLGLLSTLLSLRALFFLVVAYMGINLLYTMKIKHIALLDVYCIALGFEIRLFAGAAVTGITLSLWIIIMTFLFSLFIAFAKRRDDLLLYLQQGEKTRKSLDGYNLEMLNAALIIMAAAVTVCYIMYTVSPEVVLRGGAHAYITTAFVLLGVLRYLRLTFVENKTGAPTKVLLHDRFLQLTVLGWILTFGIILYT